MYGFKTENMKETGSTTECMDMEKSHGSMEDATKDNTSMIKNTGSELFIGLMVENTLVIGKMESSMEEASIIFPVGKRKSVNGWKEKRLNGFSKIRRQWLLKSEN